MFDFFRVVPKRRTVKVRQRQAIIFNNPPVGMKMVFNLATLLFVGALIYLAYLYWPLATSLVNYQLSQNSKANNVAISEITPVLPVEIKEEPKNEIFSIQIPKILANAKIVKNVSPYDQAEYLKVLNENTVAQAKGTALPGDGNGKSVYIFAHSTEQGLSTVRKNSVFYLLGELKKDDLVFIFYGDKVYSYQVYNQKIVNASQVEYLKYSEPDRELLILQTCWPIGTDWKRLLVFAKRI